MDGLEELYEEMKIENMDDPTGLAWKLLTDDTFYSDYGCRIQTFNADGYDEENDPNTFFFEILLHIFLSLIQNISLIMDSGNESKISHRNLFHSDPEKFDLNLYLPTIEAKFRQLAITIVVSEYKIDDYNEDDINNIVRNRYCRIVTRNQKKNEHYFYENNVPDNEMFHMILSETYKKKINLKDTYAILMNNTKLYKIHFDLCTK